MGDLECYGSTVSHVLLAIPRTIVVSVGGLPVKLLLEEALRAVTAESEAAAGLAYDLAEGDVVGYGVDVEIVVYGGLDQDTELQIEEARKAAAMLEEYGVLAIVVPSTVEWSHGFYHGLTPYPQLVINGKVVAEGRVVDAETIVREAIVIAFSNGRGNYARAPASKRDDHENHAVCVAA